MSITRSDAESFVRAWFFKYLGPETGGRHPKNTDELELHMFVVLDEGPGKALANIVTSGEGIERQKNDATIYKHLLRQARG